METLLVNCNNWSGKEVEVQILDDNTFTLHGTDYTFVTKEKVGDDYFIVLVTEEGEEVAEGWYSDGWYEFEAWEITRSSTNKFEAAVQLMMNIL